MTPTLQADPDCALPAALSAGPAEPARDGRPPTTPDRQTAPLVAHRVSFDSIDPAEWDRLASLNPYATPFSRWAFHRAWWDGYGAGSHADTLVVTELGSANRDRIVAIAPLMHRHVIEPTDAVTHTSIRHGSEANLTSVPPTACAIYFGASYHADYATLLADPADLPAVADAVVGLLMSEQTPGADHPDPWDAVDLRRLRSVDPAFDALAAAFGAHEMAEGWTLNIEQDDVCPVTRIPEGADIDGFLATLGKKERHEIRRKVRRAESVGEVELVESTDPLADLDTFIDLHQRKWGADGLFPSTPGGDQSRVFIRRLFELFPREPVAGSQPGADRHPTLHLSFLTIAGKRVAASIHFETRGALLYYNAGVDPDARELSPGVVMLERLVRRAIERGKCRVDLLRGNEPYKYEWGGIDEPVQRILVRRRTS